MTERDSGSPAGLRAIERLIRMMYREALAQADLERIIGRYVETGYLAQFRSGTGKPS